MRKEERRGNKKERKRQERKRNRKEEKRKERKRKEKKRKERKGRSVDEEIYRTSHGPIWDKQPTTTLFLFNLILF